MLIELALEIEKEKRKRILEKTSTYAAKIKHYQTHPFDYLVERLGIKPETLDWSLIPDGTENPLMLILNSLAGWKWVGVESAKGIGKTFLGAGIVYWFLECFENSLVVTTAPKQDQLSLQIWKEIGRMHNNFGRGTLTSLKLRMNENRDDWIAVGYVAGIDANEADSSAKRAQGFHAEHMLIVFEETPGIKQPVMNAFQDTCGAPHNLILALGNPDHQFDTLHKFCMLNNVTHVRLSAYDHPNVVTGNPDLIPGATSKADIQRKLHRYGEKDNPMFQTSVRGISPKQSHDALIQMQWCIEAKDETNRDRTKLLKGEPALGVDVANSETGDRAAIAKGHGAVLLEINDFQCPDSNQLGKRDVATLMREDNIKETFVGVDGVGVGAGTVNALKELGYKVVNIQSAASPVSLPGQEENFDNLRSQMWWYLREDLRKGKIILPNDNELFADLVTPRWMIREGNICVEKKEEIKKRLGRSPNKGDAVVYWNWVRTGRNKPAAVKSEIY